MTDIEDELDRLWAVPRGEEVETSALGWPMRLADGPSFVSQYREIFVSEIYAFPSPTDSPVIVDGGANTGMATIWWLARWPDARIVAFEPDPQIFAMLAHNVRHQQTDRLELRRAALSTGALGATFLPDGADGGRLVGRGESGADALEVPSQSLAELLRALEHVDLLKLDIEGAETDVLQEAAAELHRVGALFVEYHSFAGGVQSLPELLTLLRDAGFRLYVESPVTAVRPLHGVDPVHGIDLQLNIWGYRLDQPAA
jgi:FkbM family methyltransferase